MMVSLPLYTGGESYYDSLQVALSGGGTVLLPGRTIDVSEPVAIPDRIRLIGQPGTVLRATAPMDYVLGNPSAGYATQLLDIENVTIDCGGVATTGLKLYKALRGGATRVKVLNAAGDGIVLDDCQGGTFTELVAEGSGGDGIVAQDCNASKLYSPKATDNGGSGIVVRKSSLSAGCFLYGPQVERNGRHGLWIKGTRTPVGIFGGWIEESGSGDALRFEDCVASAHGVRATGIGSGSNYACHLLGTFSTVTIGSDCYFARGSGDASFGTVRDDSTSGNNVVGEWIDGAFNRRNVA